MRNADLISEIAKRTGTRKIMWLLLIILILSNFCLSLYVIFNKQIVQTIIIPPEVRKTLSITNIAFSKEYLEEMAPYTAYLLFNATPQTVEFQHQQLLKFTAASYHGALEKELRQTQLYIQKNNISTFFIVQSAAGNVIENTTVLTGEFVVQRGEQVISKTIRKLLVSFDNDNGKLELTSIKEIKSENQEANEAQFQEKQEPIIVTVEEATTTQDFTAGGFIHDVKE